MPPYTYFPLLNEKAALLWVPQKIIIMDGSHLARISSNAHGRSEADWANPNRRPVFSLRSLSANARRLADIVFQTDCGGGLERSVLRRGVGINTVIVVVVTRIARWLDMVTGDDGLGHPRSDMASNGGFPWP